jgi:hypothetical protein
MEIADYIHSLNYDTCLAESYAPMANQEKRITNLCQSACAWVILAGRKRTVYGDNLYVDFHPARNYLTDKKDENGTDFFLSHLRNYEKEDSEVYKNWESLVKWSSDLKAGPETTPLSALKLMHEYSYFTTKE